MVVVTSKDAPAAPIPRPTFDVEHPYLLRHVDEGVSRTLVSALGRVP